MSSELRACTTGYARLQVAYHAGGVAPDWEAVAAIELVADALTAQKAAWSCLSAVHQLSVSCKGGGFSLDLENGGNSFLACLCCQVNDGRSSRSE